MVYFFLLIATKYIPKIITAIKSSADFISFMFNMIHFNYSGSMMDR